MKRIVEHAWRKPADEKIPLSSKTHGVDNGTLAKNGFVYSSGKEKMAEEKKVETDASGLEESESMSVLRKFAMFLSLNLIALYFATFAWLIPCRIPSCKSAQEWEVILQNMSISTNVEVSGIGNSGLLIFGYIGENSGVTAVTTSAGSVKWKAPLDFSPVHCHCNVVDVNGDGGFDCLILGESYVLALNALNGYVFWTQEFDMISPSITTINGCDDTSRWIVLVVNRGFGKGSAGGRHREKGINMVLLDSRNGTVMKYLPLPCNFFPKQLVTWESKTNITRLGLQCSYNSETKVQIISEQQICGLVFGRSSLRMKTFSDVFSFESSTAVDDVLLFPVSHVGLVVGWFTMVAIATDARNPPRLLWQTKPGSIRSAIKFISAGHYTSRNWMQIAVVLHENSSHSVKIVNVSDGTVAASVDLGSGSFSSVRSVSGSGKNLDSLMVIKEGAISPASNGTTDSTTETAFGVNATMALKPVYLLVDFLKGKNITEIPIDYKITEAAVKSDDCITVFLAASLSNQTSRISSRFLRDQNSKNTCSCR